MSPRQIAYYATLHHQARRHGKNLQDCLAWLDRTRTGSVRAAIRHQMDAPAWQTTVELMLRDLYRLYV